MFGIHVSNKGVKFVYGLPEGHWPGHKGPNEVLSMLHHCILDSLQCFTSKPKRLVLHADNCCGQNKNRYTLWFCSWLVTAGLFNEVQLCFLVAWHTKNLCDGAFGNIKKKYGVSQVLYPEQKHKLIHLSSANTSIVHSTEVKWNKWKCILEAMFTVPTALKITHYHVFSFSDELKGQLSAK